MNDETRARAADDRARKSGAVNDDGARDVPCVQHMFEVQARKNPHAVAVSCGDDVLTYAELSRMSTALANHLRSRGVQPNTLVAILMDRSVDMVVALLGILAAGAAYLPLDPDFPSERLACVVADSRASLIVTQARLKQHALSLLERCQADTPASAPVVLVVLDEERRQIFDAVCSTDSSPAAVTGLDLAYVIYTSGSTGKPKGVMITHGGLSNLLVSMMSEPGMTQSDTLLAVTTISFDMAQLELLLPLVCGARCCVCDAQTTRDAAQLADCIRRVRPTIMQATPATWTMLCHSGWENPERVRIFCGGEALSKSLKEYFVNTNSEAWNLYGPTETTIYSTGTRIERDMPITIGRPILNTRVYIVDECTRLVPRGEPGELCIAGIGLAQGYLNRPELTAEKFIDNPFEPGGKLYRTGDLGRWNEDGQIEYLGRLDFQVKIRGFRIELGDIEYHLSRHEAVRECVVVARGETGSKQLVAYYVLERANAMAAPMSARTLREHLRDKLPAYMIPEFFVPLDAIPLTGSGKVDRNALTAKSIMPAMDPASGATVTDPPRTPEEKILADIWAQVLETRDFGRSDDFFDLGGSSLGLTRMFSLANQRFGTSVELSSIGQGATLESLSKFFTRS